MICSELLASDASELVEHYPNRREKFADGWVHGVGLFATFIGGVLLAAFSWARGGFGQATATSLFALCLMILLGCSAVYNLSRPCPQRRLLRRLDEAAIFFMIAGSYTPFTTQRFEPYWNVAITVLVWIAALAGAAGKLFAPKLSEKFWCGVYVAFGWLAVLLLQPMLAHVPMAALVLLGAGGLIYTGGVFVFLNPNAPYRRAIWHSLVLVAAGLHYGAILTGVVWA